MESNLLLGLFLVLFAALTGGVLVKLLRLQPIIGYILAGIIFGSIWSWEKFEVSRLAEIGAILLLFSVGLELSLGRLRRIFKVAVAGGILQILFTTLLLFLILTLFKFEPRAAFLLAFAFSLSSTALVVKILGDRGEMDTIHGELMIGWLLIQDLAVIPLMVILPAVAQAGGGWWGGALLALAKAVFILTVVIILGRILAPFIIHKVAATASRELLVISAVALALGTAILTSFFGISAALGAFLAGVVISETQENHAVFAETRPLRDLFVALFFVTLGFTVKFSLLFSHLGLIFLLVIIILISKFLIFLFLSFGFGYHGKTAFQASLGLTQVGEFSFIIFSQATALNFLSSTETAIGIMVALISIISTPVLFKLAVPVWRKINDRTQAYPAINKLVSGWDRKSPRKISGYKNHIIICGYGRMGSWIGKALSTMGTPFVVVDYNQTVVTKAKKSGIETIFGDPGEIEVLGQAGVAQARALVVAIPDRITQEELITTVQTLYPHIKIYCRAHFDEDLERLRFLRVDKVVQPEFEAAVAITRSILENQGKTKDEISSLIKSLRLSKALIRI